MIEQHGLDWPSGRTARRGLCSAMWLMHRALGTPGTISDASNDFLNQIMRSWQRNDLPMLNVPLRNHWFHTFFTNSRWYFSIFSCSFAWMPYIWDTSRLLMAWIAASMLHGSPGFLPEYYELFALSINDHYVRSVNDLITCLIWKTGNIQYLLLFLHFRHICKSLGPWKARFQK